MQISFTEREGRVPVTIMHLAGNLDASNYTEVIKQAQELFDRGTRSLIMDLGNVPYISSAGLMALHTVVLVFMGRNIQDGSGRPAFRSIDIKHDQAARQYVKLLNPQPAVDQVLEMVGLKEFFEIFSDLESAIKSF